jgi:hypothetical protein
METGSSTFAARCFWMESTPLTLSLRYPIFARPGILIEIQGVAVIGEK